MIARSALPWEWVVFNAASGAPCSGPFGHAPFPWMPTTRVAEYAWAAHAVTLGPGMKTVDIGGGWSGFATALAGAGVDVIVVDPDPELHVPVRLIERSAEQFGSRVVAIRSAADRTGLEPSSVDVAFCISVVEHIDLCADREALMSGVHDLLKPGGSFVLTVDLVLDLAPFTAVPRRGDLRNVDLNELIDPERFDLVFGVPSELCGMPGFDPAAIARRAASGEFLVAAGGIMSQCFVLTRR